MQDRARQDKIHEYNKIIAKMRMLNDLILYHDQMYYENDDPVISDAEYDKLRQEINMLEKQRSEIANKYGIEVQHEAFKALTSIGNNTQNNKFQKVPHSKPMLSLDNAFDKDDLDAFIKRMYKFLNISQDTQVQYCIEHKIDGLSAAIIYVNGNLHQALTRGDGYIGEDVTHNVMTIKSIPKQISIPGTVEVRGEIYMPTKAFLELNASSYKSFSSPRNAASGSLRQLDPHVTESRCLNFFAYSLDVVGQDVYAKQTDRLSALESLGFQVAEHYTANSPQAIMQMYQTISDRRQYLPYEIDGIVVKVDDLKLQEKLGFAGRTPRHSIAIKFNAIETTTEVVDLEFSVGRTGKITPVAILNPVTIMGATITRVTMHNFDEIARHDLRIGDTVKLIRSGDVIPKITENIKDAQHYDRDAVTPPSHCPSCGATLQRENDCVDIFCINPECTIQMLRYMEYLVSRNCFNIIGLGAKQIAQFHKAGMLHDPSDIFELHRYRYQISKLDGWGAVSANNLIESIEKSRHIKFDRFIASLGINGIGVTAGYNIAKKFKTIDDLMCASLEDLESIDMIGKVIANNLHDFLALKRDFIIKLLGKITIQYESDSSDKAGDYYNKIVVFTGTLSMSRGMAKELAKKRGMQVTTSVSSKTDYLVCGDKPGSKLKKAQELGVTILYEDDWVKL